VSDLEENEPLVASPRQVNSGLTEKSRANRGRCARLPSPTERAIVLTPTYEAFRPIARSAPASAPPDRPYPGLRVGSERPVSL